MSHFQSQDPRQRWVVSRDPPLNCGLRIGGGHLDHDWTTRPGILGLLEQQVPRLCWAPVLSFMGPTATASVITLAWISYIEPTKHLQQRSGFEAGGLADLGFPNRPTRPLTASRLTRDVPCNVVAMPKIRDGQLEWLQNHPQQ